MKEAILLLPAEHRDAIYGKENLEALRKFVDLEDCCDIVGNLEALKPHLADAEIICSGWGMMNCTRATPVTGIASGSSVLLA